MTKKIRKVTDKKGLRILFIPHQGDSLAFLILVGIGSEYEKKKESGISHFIEHTLFKGTKNRPKPEDISLELDKIGSAYNAFTSYEYTGYYAKARKEHFDVILDVISDIYLNPTFPKEEIKKEKGVVLEELKMYLDRPETKTNNIFMNLFYRNQSTGRPIIGLKENIEKFQREDLISFKEKNYTSKRTIVVICGDIDFEKAKEKIIKKFSDLKKGKSLPKIKIISPSSFQSKIVFKKIEQVHLNLGFPLFSIFSKKRYVAEVISALLSKGMSSRMWKVLREELGSVYWFSTEADLFLTNGLFILSTALKKEKFLQSLEAIFNELSKLKKEKVKKDELEKSKEILKTNLVFSLESVEKEAVFYGLQELLLEKVIKLEEFFKEIDKVDSEMILDFSKKYFSPNKLRIAVFGPEKKILSYSKIKKILRE